MHHSEFITSREGTERSYYTKERCCIQEAEEDRKAAKKAAAGAAAENRNSQLMTGAIYSEGIQARNSFAVPSSKMSSERSPLMLISRPEV